MTGVVHVKDGTTWKAVNFNGAKIWVKHSGTWKEPTGVWVRHSGTWKKVYPSDLEAWTTSNLGTEASFNSWSFAKPKLSTDPQYVYTNILLPRAHPDYHEVRWAGRYDGTGGSRQWVYSEGLGWTPVTSAGFHYGAVTRVEITFSAAKQQSNTAFSIETFPSNGNYYSTGELTTSTTTYTFDYTIAAWDLSSEEAGRLHTDARGAYVQGWFDNSSGSTTDSASVGNFKCRIRYKYN